MCDTSIIVLCEKWSHGNDVLRIVVLDEAQVAKLSLSGIIIDNDVGGLHIDAFATRLGAYEVDFSSLQLSHIYLISQTNEMLVNDVLYHFLDVALTCTSRYCIANAIVLKVKLVVGLEDSLAMNVVAVHLV